jgi:hypothetical protein
MDGLSFSLAWLIPAVFLASAGATCLAWARRRHGASLRLLFSLDRPLWAVYAGIPLVWWVCLWIGGDAHSIVLLHVAAWWVFSSATLARFGKKGGPGELGLFGWMRRTQAGFQTLHVGLALLVLLAAFLWVYRFGMADSSPLAWIVKQEYFYYWTLMHVTVSFVPRPSRG